MLKIGLTGGIGSGKSTVSNVFRCLDIPVFNADEAGRLLLAGEPVILDQIKNIFGEQVLSNGKPDRKKMSEIVFTNPGKLAQLNSVIHPAVREKFNEWVNRQNAPYVIDEAAILFETRFYRQLDYTILVVAPEPIRIKRIMQRDGMEEASIRNRMKNQWSDEEKKKLAGFVIMNDDINPILPQVMDIHHKLIARGK